MADLIVRNSGTAALRRMRFYITSDDGSTPWTGSVTGVKAQLSFQEGAEAASTNDIVRVGGYWHYVELTQAESNVGAGKMLGRVPAAAGRLEAPGEADIIPDDPYAAALSFADLWSGDVSGINGANTPAKILKDANTAAGNAASDANQAATDTPAIKAKTDDLTFSTPGVVDARVARVGNVALNNDGPPFGQA